MDTNEQAHNQRPRLNPFAFPSNTDFRFVTLIVGVLGASLFIYYLLYAAVPINRAALNSVNRHCQAVTQAAFPGNSFADQQAASIFLNQCLAPIQHNEAAWLFLGLALLLAVTVALYWVLPSWKIWRGGLRPLNAGNTPSDLLAHISGLCHEAELSHTPIFLLNPYSSASSGLTFGRFRRYYVVLNSGLMILFQTDRPAFRAIVLHELGHIRNADIDKTYLSITVGWAFVIAALIPWLIVQCIPPWHFDQILGIGWRILALSILIYLTRKAILRTREVYADVRASVWDKKGTPKAQDGALSRVINSLPATKKDHWRYLLRNHPNPRERYQILSDTSQLFRVGFWDALAVGIVVTAAISGLNFLLGFLRTEVSVGPINETVWALGFAVLVALMIIGIVGSSVWRATFANLLEGTTRPQTIQACIALVLGLLLGQTLPILSLASFNSEALPTLLPEQITLPSLLEQGAFFLTWDILLMIVLFLLLRWVRACAATWLDVVKGYSSLGWTYWITLVIASVVSGIWFEQLTGIQSIAQVVLNPSDPNHAAILDSMQTALGTSFSDLRIAVVLFNLLALAIDPLICLAFIGLWAYPLASWFWRKRQPHQVDTTWAWLDASPKAQTSALPYQAFIRPGLVLILGLSGGLIFCGLLPLFVNGLGIPLSSDEKLVLAVLLQTGIAAIVACHVERLRVMQGLCAAFVAGCIMTADIEIFNLLHQEQVDFITIWGTFVQVVNGGALIALLVTLLLAPLATWIRRLARPLTRMRIA